MVKLRFPDPIPSPGSALHTSGVSSSAPSSSNKYNYHSVLITQATYNPKERSFTVRAYSIPAYSKVDFAAALQKLHPTERQSYIPILPADTSLTPAAFGGPVTPTTRDASGNVIPFRDRIPSWIVMRPLVITYPPTRTWKEYKDPVIFSQADVQRIEQYYEALYIPPSDPSPVVNCVATPQEPSPGMLELFISLDQCAVLNFDDEGASDSEHDGDSEDGRSLSRIDLYRLLARPGTDDWMRRKVEEVDTQQRKEKNQITERWVRQTQDYSGTMATSEEGAWALVEGTFTPAESIAAFQASGDTGEGFLDLTEGWRGEDGLGVDNGGGERLYD